MAALGVHVELEQARDDARRVGGEGEAHVVEDGGAIDVKTLQRQAVGGDVARGAHRGVVLGLRAVAEARGVADGEQGVEGRRDAVGELRLQHAGEF